MVWRYKLQFTDKTLTLRKCMYMRANGASELRKFWHFPILKLLFLSIFMVLHLPCLRNIFNFRCQITSANSAYIYNQCSFRLLLMVWCYINDSIPTNTNIEQMYVCVCERAERASLQNVSFFTFLKLLFLSIFCRYIRYFVVQMTCLSAYMYRQIFKMYRQNSEKALWGGGGGVAPPPPSGYANGGHIMYKRTEM